MGAHDYQKLDVWKRSIDLTSDVYTLVRQLPLEEKYALGDQMRRCVVSVPSNIAEGQKRFTVKDTLHLTTVALGSLAELETQLIIVQRVYAINTTELLEECGIISRMLHALINSLRNKT